MATELTMPRMGFDMREGRVVRWLKPEGSAVRVGEIIAEIETDKAVVEFESYVEGVLAAILVPEGVAVAVGQPIAIIAAVGEKVSAPPPSAAPAERPRLAAALAPATETRPDAAEVGEASPERARVSPLARRIAADLGVDLSQVSGSGPEGRIVAEDVRAFHQRRPHGAAPPAAPAAAPPAPPPPAPAGAGARVPLSRMRQQIARVTVRSKQTTPHFYVTAEVDMGRAMDLRKEVNDALADEAARATVNDIIIKAAVGALTLYPKFNAFFADDGIQMNEQINIGVAVAEEEGLIIPAILDCARRSLADIARASRDLVQRARSGALRPQEYTGATFTISNLGMFDVEAFTAIIQPPQSAVLAVGTIAQKPVARDGQVVIGRIMTATLSADHRVVDGAEGARFLGEVKRLLENPILLLL